MVKAICEVWIRFKRVRQLKMLEETEKRKAAKRSASFEPYFNGTWDIVK
ncbi:hypothetical protein GJ688_03820 [Heliobacillus mobilis]|uniref:Uncharacterized protein n=1 Tax=Heliobacterium mobile TaxID=28064 RepID=A0A6I3SGY8_HELMO|nr:hypothetical protein [Heliobacterium mobile]MTV48109.1 hypothetical protein [Heliobacterium mobile]